jgi:hypothetical protein
MSGQNPAAWRQGPDGQWYPYQPYPGTTGSPQGEAVRRRSPFLQFLKTVPLVVKLLLAIFGGGTTITIIFVIGSIITAAPVLPVTHRYSASVQEQWMNDCESRSFNAPSTCQCELSYFEVHAGQQQFEQDYGAMPPGVVPPELAGAEDCSTN